MTTDGMTINASGIPKETESDIDELYDQAVAFVTTDKVYRNVEKLEGYAEDEPLGGKDPYSASKAGQGAAGIAYANTYNLPIITTYTMNLYGARQHKEKLVAKAIDKIYNTFKQQHMENI